MFDGLLHLFDTEGFPARWFCGSAWAEEPIVGWLHIVSDLVTFASYFAVPGVVAFYVTRKKDLDFPPIFWIFFGLIFFSCGSVHLLEAGIFWWPAYRLSALLKVITAVVSSIGVVVLARSLPRALDLKTPEQLDAEITERRDAQAKLAFETNLLHTLMNHLPDAIYFKDQSGKYLRVSRALADKLKLSDVAEATGKSESDFLADAVARDIQQDDQSVFNGDKTSVGRIEKEPWGDGSDEKWVSTTRLPLRDSGGEVIGTFGISHDVTEIKQAEEKLARLAQRLALPRESSADRPKPLALSHFRLQDMISCGSDIRSMGGRYPSRASLDTALAEYLYQRVKADDGHPAFALVRMFQTTRFADLDRECQQIAVEGCGGTPPTAETRCLTLQGTAGVEPAWNDRRRSQSHRVIPLPSVDAVERLPMIAELIRSLGFDVGGILDGRSELLIRARDTSVFHVRDARGSQYIPAQDDFVAAYGIESVIGFGDLLPNGDLFAVICFSRVPINEQTAALFSHLSISTKLALMAHVPAADRVEGQITAVDQMIQNYERVVCEQESLLRGAMGDLEQARDNANAANRAKSEFLANMSHEIRTPMNAILGMTELVLGDEIPDQDREYLNTVLESGESLLSIINEILDFSKIEAGRIELDPSVMDIREVMGDMVKPLAVRAHRKQIELACEIAADVPQFVVADVARLRQIIVNLVGNAIKFTDDGEVVVSLGIDSSDDAVNDASVALKFCVSDTGVGIPAHQLDSIFDAFAQGDTSTTRRFGGTGLGLAISTDLVRLMGGEIKVESEVDSGSQFSFTLRLPKADSPTDRAEPRPDQVAGMHVLVVDDNDTNRHILDKMLTSWGMKPIATPDADAALRVLRQRQASGHPVEVVVTDVHMPGKDGFQLVEELRNTESIADTPVIILTSGAGRDDARRCQQLRVVAHLMKPVKQSELLDALLLTVTDGQATNAMAPAVDTVDTSAQRPLHVLLVEDGLANQKLAIGLLERWGHQVETAENGAIAVDLCSSRSFDLILMDLQMPVMDGIEATRRIRAAESGTSLRVPIIAMTAHALVGDRQRCIDAGMDDYVSKPIRQKELYRAIGSIAAPKAPPAVSDAPPALSDAPPALTEAPPALTEAPPALTEAPQADSTAGPPPAHRDQDGPLNLDQVLEVMDQDRGILVSVIQAFIDESPDLLEQMEQALRQNDPAMLERAAHTLKGNYMILRQDGLQSLSGQVEELARQQRLDAARRPVDQLRTNTIAIVGQLREYVVGG